MNHPVKGMTMFSLSGDFEAAGANELLAADRPTEADGVEVSQNIATNEERTKFAKVARAMPVKDGASI